MDSAKKKKFEPITVEKEYGKFTMEHDFNDRSKPSYEYEGIVDWCGHEAKVIVVIQTRDNLTVDAGFARLEKLLADSAKAAELDGEMKERTFNGVVQVGMVNDIFFRTKKGRPIENPEPITKGQFLEHFELQYIQVDEDMYDGCQIIFNFLIFIYNEELGIKNGRELSFFIDDDNNVADFEMAGDWV